MLDLSSLQVDSSKIIDVVITDPRTGNPLMDAEGNEAIIHVVGQDSDAYKRVQRGQQNKRLNQMSRSRSVKLNADDLEAEALELLVACVKSWENISLKGTVLECVPDNVRTLFKAIPIVKEQVDFAISDRVGFLGNLKTNS